MTEAWNIRRGRRSRENGSCGPVEVSARPPLRAQGCVMLDQSWTPEAGYSHAAAILARLQAKEAKR
jgi:hypothetical protein